MPTLMPAACSRRTVHKWPAEPIEPTAKFSGPGVGLAAATRPLTSVAPTLLPIAIDSGACATKLTGAKSVCPLSGTAFIVLGAGAKVVLAPQADRSEVGLHLVRHRLHRHRRGDEGAGVEQQRVAVGARLRDGVAA